MPSYQTLISVSEAAQFLTTKQAVFLDCRYNLADVHEGRRKYLQRHIPGAIYMDMGTDLSAPVIPGETGRHPLPHPDVLATTIRAAGVHAETQVVVYDQSTGGYAARAWWLLRWLGHPHVALLNGGFTAWEKAGLPVDNINPPPADGQFRPRVDWSLLVDRQTLKSTSRPIVDSREMKRYLGEIEPIDPVAGHIPRAVCYPFMENIDTDGLWRSREDLAARFSTISDAPEPPVFYCGSGVTACHNILAYKIATDQDALLYPGSWSEWLIYEQPA